MVAELGLHDPNAKSNGERLQATVLSVVYHNEENGFVVLRVQETDEDRPFRVTGHFPRIDVGERVTVTGKWVTHEQHGKQFRAQNIEVVTPTTTSAMISYLGSGAVAGVGPKRAKAIVNKFGTDTFDVLTNAPHRLAEVSELGKAAVKAIVKDWREKLDTRDAMYFLHSIGLGPARSATICKRYGVKTKRIVEQDPYRLIHDFRGVGFVIADRVALKMGVARNAPARLQAGILFSMREAVNREGHCALSKDALAQEAVRLLECDTAEAELAIERETATGELVADSIDGEPYLFPRLLHNAEKTIAQDLRRLQSKPVPWGEIDANKALAWAEKEVSLNLATSQRSALACALQSKIMVLTGGPGVGKTTIVSALLRILGEREITFHLCAPTGRAAKRMSEATGEEASTIHRLLEFNPFENGFLRNRGNPLETQFVVVDEVSMVDVELFSQLMAAMPTDAALLLVGDSDQLPSVGPGQVLTDIIQSKVVPVERLQEVFRQAGESQILNVAHCINRGKPVELNNELPDSDLFFWPTETQAETAKRVVKIVKERIPEKFGLDPLRDVQVLSPMRNGDAGVFALNQALQQALNGTNIPNGVKLGDNVLAPNDRVMQVRNNYDKEVYNGDIGFIQSVKNRGQVLVVKIDDRLIEYERDDLDQLRLAYAATIHKSQGSEYPAVVIALHKAHFIMLHRNLIYTAVTRGRQLVVLIGEAAAVQMAIRKADREKRLTKLRDRLQEAAGDEE